MIAVARTCVQAYDVDLGGPWLGDVPTNVGANGHSHVYAPMLDSSRGSQPEPFQGSRCVVRERTFYNLFGKVG